MSLKKNLIKNGFASALQKIIRIAEQILLVPFFITAWGAAYYGEWLTLTVIPSVLAFSELGFGTAAANQMVLQYASGNKQGASDTAKTGFFVVSLLIIFSISLSLVLIFILDHIKLLDKSLIDRTDAIWAISLLMLARLFNFYQPLCGAFFRSARKSSISMNLQAIYALLNLIGGLLVLSTGNGVVLFALINLIISVLYNPFFIWRALKVLPDLMNYNGVILQTNINIIAKKGFGYLLFPIWEVLYFQGTTLAIRITLGPIAVAIFNTVRTLTRSINQLFQVVTQSVMPELQYEVGSNNIEKAKNIFRLTFAAIVMLAFIGIGFLYYFGISIYDIWTQKSLNAPINLWNIFLISIAFHALWWVTTIVFQAYNTPYYLTLPGLIAATISVMTTYFLSQIYGLTGAALGALVLDVLLSIYMIPKACNLLTQSISKLLEQTINDSTEKLLVILNKYFKLKA